MLTVFFSAASILFVYGRFKLLVGLMQLIVQKIINQFFRQFMRLMKDFAMVAGPPFAFVAILRQRPVDILQLLLLISIMPHQPLHVLHQILPQVINLFV